MGDPLWSVAEQGCPPPRRRKSIHDHRAAPDRASIHNIGRFIRQGLVRTLAVIEDKVFRQTDHQFAHRGVTLQIHVLVLNGAPEPLDEDVVKHPPRPSILITTLSFQYIGKRRW